MWFAKCLAFCGAVFIFTLQPLQAQVIFKNVEANGCGEDEASALLESLQNALAQVGGMKLEVTVAMQMKETVRSSKVEFTSNYQQDIERQTRGIIKSYRVLNRTEKNARQICVSVAATVPTFKVSEQLKRLKLVVAPLTVHPKLSDKPDARQFAGDVSAALEAQLTSTRKFAMLDRRFGAQTDIELRAIIDGSAPIEETAKIRLQAGADYVVLASLRDFSSRASEGRSPLGRPITRIIAPASIDVRVIDIATRQVKFAQSYVHSGRLLAGENLNQHSAKIGADIGDTISTAIYPIAVVAVSDTDITLNQGGDSMRVGRIYRLVVLGQNLIDPHTLESLGLAENEVARAQVTSVTDRTSHARIVGGSVKDAKGQQMLARILPDEEPAVLNSSASGANVNNSTGQPPPVASSSSDEW